MRFVNYWVSSYLRTEKNATPWSKERIKTLLKDLEIETDEGMFIGLKY